MTSSKKILEELKKRVKEEQENKKPALVLSEICFPRQLQFIEDSSRFKTACTSRRSGKSNSIIRDMIYTCITNKNIVCLYITITKKNARSIIWGDLKDIIEQKKIKCKIDETRLYITFPNKSEIRIEGCKDESEGEKFRGWKLKKAYIDECQSFRSYIKKVIDDCIIPSLRDLRGQLILTGTPGPLPHGAFYDYTHAQYWSHHYWTAFENPYMHDPENGKDLNITLSEERAVKGITEADPSYQRETYGLWIKDENALVFKFDSKRNITTTVPKNLEYIFGIDLGFEDSDAIAVIGYNYEEDKVYLVEEKVKNKQGLTELVASIEDLRKIYKPIKMMIDEGGLGKKLAEEIRQRYQIPVEPAEKSRKMEFIELLNDDLRTGKFKAFKGSRFEEDCYLVQWDRSNSDKLKISDGYHSDITDSVLYAWRECKHYLNKQDKKPDLTLDQKMDNYELQMAESLKNKQEEPWWSDDKNDEIEPEIVDEWSYYEDSE